MQHNANRGQIKAKRNKGKTYYLNLFYSHTFFFFLLLVFHIEKSRGKLKYYKYFINKSIYVIEI